MYISSLGHNKRYPLLCLTANHRCYAVLLTAQAYKTFLMHYSDCITISSPRVLKNKLWVKTWVNLYANWLYKVIGIWEGTCIEIISVRQ